MTHSVFRPPSEARSLILRVADGCPWNQCRFCGMYHTVKYRARPKEEWLAELDDEVSYYPDANRVFLADGDAMALPTDDLVDILETVADRLPNLQRVNMYANGCSIGRKSVDELKRLHALRLQMVYVGLESGDEETLKTMHKRETPQDMIRAAELATEAGIRLSVMVLSGLGGRSRLHEHAAATADVLNAMQPRYLSFLRVVPVQGTALGRDLAEGRFEELTEREVVVEMREMIAGLELSQTIFRANHVSNAIPLAGRFPTDKDALLQQLDALLASGFLDDSAPSPHPAFL